MSVSYAIVVSQFNSLVTENLLLGAKDKFSSLGIDEDHLTIVYVPGAVEIPLAAKLLAKTKKYAAVVCLGAVIKGETDHYEYVCQQVSYGCQKVMLKTNVPIIFGVLTTQNEELALARCGGKEGNKGAEAALAAHHMANVVNTILDKE